MSPRDRRGVTLGIAIITTAVVLLRLAPWGWRTVAEQSAELRARAEVLERMRNDLGSSGALGDSAEALRSRVGLLAPALLTGATRSHAMADLNDRLSVTAERHRVRVGRKEPLADSVQDGELGRVAMRVQLESDTRGLLTLLTAMASGTAILVTDSLRITVSDPLVTSEQAEVLRTELTISGWYLAAGVSR